MSRLTRRLSVGAALLAATVASNASALQPLSVFVQAARATNNQNRRAVATRVQREEEARVALGNALPSIDLRGVLARSQLSPSFPGSGGQPAAPLIPQNIWLGSAGVTVPISVGAWEHVSAARSTARAALSGERATALSIEREVTRDYFDVLGSEAVVLSARHGLELSTTNAATVRAMAGEGEAAALDVERARADVARAEEDLADAEGNLLRARRQLFSATGVDPDPSADHAFPVDDLHDEPPLAAFYGASIDRRPAVSQAIHTREAARESRDAARAAWLPTISASAQEYYTNATENLGRKDFYSLLGMATWHLDLALSPGVSAQDAALEAAQAAEAQARIDSQDAVYLAWVQVRTDVQKARAARVEDEAAARAADLARARFAAGEATQIDVLQAQQTYVQAEVSRISVEADLAYARVALRLSVAGEADALHEEGR